VRSATITGAAEMTALERAAPRRKPVRKFYGYGIVGKTGKPWLGKSCVCDESKLLQVMVTLLNDAAFGFTLADDPPYRVVRLFYETRKR